MDYTKFSQGIVWTEDYWRRRREKKNKRAREPKCQKYRDFSYSTLKERGDDYWLHLERMSESQLAEEIVACFLNKWNCRIPKPDTDKGRQVVRNLKKTIEELPGHYAALGGFRIEDTDFQGTTTLKCEDVPIVIVIDQIYYAFRQVKPKFGRVAASKLMHMALPYLFVMWDKEIIKTYRVPGDRYDRRSYVAFLVLMQENIRHVIETYTHSSGIAEREPVRQIQVEHGGLSIPRLLDIANYAVAHPEKEAPDIKCRECIERTNRRFKDELRAYASAVGLKQYEY